MRARAIPVVIAAAVGIGGLVTVSTVGAATRQADPVSAVPATVTPDINDGQVHAITKVGSRIVVGGTFSSATDRGSTAAVTRTDALAFDAATGRLTTGFAPRLDGAVEAVAPGPVADSVFLGGAFSTVNGVRSKGIALVSTKTGALVPSFTPPGLNGVVYSIRQHSGRTFLAGSFTVAGGRPRQGLVSIVPTTGAVTSYADLAFTGHHNYNGLGAEGSVGPRDIAISPDGRSMVAIGNFTQVDGIAHDQIARIDLTTSAAELDQGWATAAFTASCNRNAFDSYVRGVDFAPSGAYFVVVATGGRATNNTDGTVGTCDAAARFETAGSGTDVRPTWVDRTGDDTLLSVAATGPAIYVGGHQRWLNNPDAHDAAGPGATPRPGVAALDPATGLPLAWNPGRNPRGAGAYAIYATTSGLYVGSDTEYIGNRRYARKRIAYFTLAGGRSVANAASPTIPANIFRGGERANSNRLSYRHYDGRTISNATAVRSPGPTWSQVRGAFLIGNTLYYGQRDGNFYRRGFNGKTFGTARVVDPYDDPAWSDVQTGSGQTYRGVKPDFYAELPSITGMAYDNARIYYTLAGQPDLHYRFFTPDSGVIGQQEFLAASPGVDFRVSKGFFIAGRYLYWVTQGGALHRMSFTGGVPIASTDRRLSSPQTDGRNWIAYAVFLRPTR